MRICAPTFLALVALCGTAAAAPGLQLVGPDRGIGDGADPIVLRLQTTPPEAGDSLTDLQVSTDAGRVVLPSAPGHGAELQLHPPRLAADRRVTIRATARLGGRTLRARHTVRLTPPMTELGTQSSGGPLDVRGPARLYAGRARSVELTLSGSGTRPPQLAANVGRLGPVQRDGERWSVDYRIDPAGFPHLAVIAARDGDQVDWLTIPILGRARVDLRSEPNASVAVEVGPLKFGPVSTNRSGRATLTLRVPPGISEARTVATDELGNVRTGTLELSPPPFDRLVMLCPRGDHRAWVVAADAGTLPADVTIETDADPGRIDSIEAVRQGLHRASYDAPATAAEGQRVTMSARIAGDDTSEARCEATIPSEPPSYLHVSLTPPRYQAGSDPVSVTVTPRYSGRLPSREVEIDLAVDTGTIERLESTGLEARARWTLPDRLGDEREAVITARADQVEPARATLPIRPGPAATIEARIVPRIVYADGTGVELRARARDAHGNPAASDLSATATLGTIEQIETLGNGRHRIRYLPPTLLGSSTDRIRLRSGDTGATVTIPLTAAPPGLAVAARLGYSTNLAKVSGPVVAASLERGFLLRGHELGAALELGYARSRDRRRDVDDVTDIETAVDVAPVLARGWYALPLPPVHLRAGVAGGTYVGTVTASTDTAESSARGVWPALQGFAGASTPLGPGRLGAELSWTWAPIDEGGIRGNLGGVRLSVGYRTRLF